MGITDKTKLNDENDLIPIAVGVTGHRDIHDSNRDGLERAAQNVFEGLRSLYPDSPLVLVSALAEGSDRLVARVGLDFGLKLIVPLPAPIEECESRLETAESRSEFKELLGRAERYFVLPPQESGEREHRGMGEPSHDNYDRVRAFLARQCHILVALWDGAESDRPGGTAQSVRFRLKGVPEFYSSPRNLLDPVDTGPVYHIVTPRSSNPAPEGVRYSLKKLFPSGWETGEKADKAFAQVLGRINELNRDVKKFAPRLAAGIARGKEEMITSEHSGTLASATRAILEHFAVASGLSMHFQTRRRRALYSLFALAVLAVLFVEMYIHLLPQALVLALYPSILILLYAVHLWAKRQGYQDKHLDYRALAEGLRVQFYWRLVGLPDDVTDHYLRKQRSEMEWIRKAIRSCSFLVHEETASQSDWGSGSSSYQVTLRNWVFGQRSYFEGATRRDQKRMESQEKRVLGLFLAGIVLAAIAIVVDSGLVPHVEKIGHDLLILSMVLVPAIAAAIDGYGEKMAVSAQAKKYEQMHGIFSRAAEYLQRLLDMKDYASAQELIRELGREALMEDGDWVLMHRDRPMKIPVGG